MEEAKVHCGLYRQYKKKRKKNTQDGRKSGARSDEETEYDVRKGNMNNSVIRSKTCALILDNVDVSNVTNMLFSGCYAIKSYYGVLLCL
jgi:hypothetical protein